MKKPFICNRRLWLTEDKKKVVEEGDPSAAFLWAIPGHKVTEAAAEQFGLTGLSREGDAEAATAKEIEEKKVTAAAEKKAQDEKAAKAKAAKEKKAAKDKAKKKGKNK